MEKTAQIAHGKSQHIMVNAGDSVLSRKYIYPFVIACIILACNQATGINSILAYSVNILNTAGLPGSVANWGDLALKILMSLMTIIAIILVDRKGRRFLLMLGTTGIIICLASAGLLFITMETERIDCESFFQAEVKDDTLNVTVDNVLMSKAVTSAELADACIALDTNRPMQLTLVYAYGPFTNIQIRQTNATVHVPITINREATISEDNVVGRLFRSIHLNPFPDPAEGRAASLEIKKAMIGPVSSVGQGWLIAACLLGFIAFYSVGPGVCAWLALSELMPTRIRSNGMSIALLINQFVSASIAAVFLPIAGFYGYSTVFFFWSGCTVIYFLTATLVLPETKGKTLEEIEVYFSRHR